MSNWSNLEHRLLTAGLLGGGMLVAIFLAPPLAWTALIALFVMAGAWEWAGLCGFGARTPAAAYALATGLIAVLCSGLDENLIGYVFLMAMAFWFIAVPTWLYYAWPRPPRWLAVIIGWLLLLPTFLAMLYLHATGPLVLLAVLGIAILADTAAYFSGRRFGKHKLAPSISPGKTREGALGAALAVAAYALILSALSGLPRLPLLGAALVLFVLSILGDLFESWIKRQAGIKDSGTWLPGHGGVLDRIDSLTAVLPVAALLWMLFANLK